MQLQVTLFVGLQKLIKKKPQDASKHTKRLGHVFLGGLLVHSLTRLGKTHWQFFPRRDLLIKTPDSTREGGPVLSGLKQCLENRFALDS